MFMLPIDVITDLCKSSNLFGPSSWWRMVRHHLSPTVWIATANIGEHGGDCRFADPKRSEKVAFDGVADAPFYML